MAVDYFLKIDGIDGESTDSKHKDEIRIESFSWGESQSGRAAGKTGGKVAMQDFHFTSAVSKATPRLFLVCAGGDHIKQAVLTGQKSSGDSPHEFLKITFTDLIVSSYQTGGSAGGDTVPLESFSLNFAKIEWEFTPASAEGTAGSTVKAGWDLEQNAKV